jgi:hypothetical protein
VEKQNNTLRKVDIKKRAELNALLNRLAEDGEALWGVMRPQNMIEHLATTLAFSNGKTALAQRFSDEEAAAAKAAFIYTDAELPRGLKTPLLGDGAAPFVYGSMEEAKEVLNRELDAFEHYFSANPGITVVHPRLGRLDYSEWIVFHNKHFTHHFKQFGLVE